MKTTFRLGLLAVLVALTLMGVGGISLAAGDLFDDDYSDCPHNTRFRDGQISDLSVNRDSDEKDEVNVAWAATDPSTWGLGSNAYRTSLVVILDDDSNVQTKTLSLGSRNTTFDEVETGAEVTVQLAIVVDTADGDYLISDILEKSIFQNLTEPAFMTPIRSYRITEAAVVAVLDNPDTVNVDEAVAHKLPEVSIEDVGNAAFYFVGYNENFANYRADGLTTRPSTSRFRIGLAHGGENDAAREDVEFDAYIIRIEDQDGDAVSEGNDVATVPSSSYRGENPKLILGENVPGGAVAQNALTDNDDQSALYNVRVNDGGSITPAMKSTSVTLFMASPVDPASELSFASVDDLLVGELLGTFSTDPGATTYNNGPGDDPTTANDDESEDDIPNGLFALASGLAVDNVVVYADLPNEHRDFPSDVLESDETYTILAWAVNEDDEVISPVASLEVRPHDTKSSVVLIEDYLNPDPGATVRDLILTEFTVLK